MVGCGRTRGWDRYWRVRSGGDRRVCKLSRRWVGCEVLFRNEMMSIRREGGREGEGIIVIGGLWKILKSGGGIRISAGAPSLSDRRGGVARSRMVLRGARMGKEGANAAAKR